MPPATQTRRITISVDTKGSQDLKALADQLGGLNKNTKQLSQGMGFLTSATATWLGGISIKEIAGFSDQIQNLNNRLLALTGNQEEASKTLNELVGVSRATNQSLEGTAETYLRMSGALRDVGISQSTLIDTTKTIANTFRLSGASTEEAKNATIQLGQAFSIGALRGQDLRSVMSQNITLTRLLRKEFGNGLLKQAEKGLITDAKIFEVLHKNMEQINSDAQKMGATFEQSTTKALDAFKLKIYEISSSLGTQAIFAKGVQWVIDHMGQIVTILGVIATVTIPALAVSLGSLAISFGLLSPGVLIITGLATALIALNPAAIGALSPIQQIDYAIGQLDLTFFRLIERITDFTKHAPGILGVASKVINALAGSIAGSEKDRLDEYDKLAEKTKKLQDTIASKDASTRAKQYAADLEKLKTAFKVDPTAEQILGALNEQFEKGSITIAEYNKQVIQAETNIAKLKFHEGKIDLGKRNDAIRKLQTFQLNQQLDESTISLTEYRKAIESVKLDNLNEDLAAGRISLEKFNQELVKTEQKLDPNSALIAGTSSFIESIGTVSSNVADAISKTFGELENALVDFIKTGKFNFASFTQAILDDLTRIIIRATIIRPLAEGILGSALFNSGGGGGGLGGSTVGAQPQAFAAKGNVFDHGMKKFAMGGIVDYPTPFAYGSGKNGIMGEAGPEAIIPLRRGSGGELGVSATTSPVIVNIINQNGSDVKQSESVGPNGEKTLDIVIAAKVKDGILGGQFDNAFKSAFGIKRRGA